MRKLLSSHRSLYVFTLAAFVVGIMGATGTPFVGADSQVGGIISEDTTWTAENSPYEITETVQISSGVTLTIEPGVMISRSSSGDMFVLMGTICAHGTSQEPIVIDGGATPKSFIRSLDMAMVIFSIASFKMDMTFGIDGGTLI